MLSLSYDLHIHSCLSPCGDDDMTPGNIVGMAALKGLDVIAVTDHNSCKNSPAVMKLAAQYDILAIAGMELTTMEEVHVLCLFPNLSAALEWDAYVYEHLVPIPNNEKIFGKQQILNEEDEEWGIVENLLINATDISFDAVYALVKKKGGVMIPAHVDKTANSLFGNLGFVPPDSKFACAELKDIAKLHRIKDAHPYIAGCNIISNSDAHYLHDIQEPIHYIYAEEKRTEAVLKALER